MSQNRRHKAITQTHIRLWKHEKRFARILLIRNESANRFFSVFAFLRYTIPTLQTHTEIGEQSVDEQKVTDKTVKINF